MIGSGGNERDFNQHSHYERVQSILTLIAPLCDWCDCREKLRVHTCASARKRKRERERERERDRERERKSEREIKKERRKDK